MKKYKNYILSGLIVLILLLTFTYLIIRVNSRAYKVIKFNCDQFHNISRHSMSWVLFKNKKGIGSAPVAKGDFIQLVYSDDDYFILLYENNMGSQLMVTNNNGFLYNDNKIISISVSGNSNFLNDFTNKKVSEFKYLNSIIFENDISSNHLKYVINIIKSYPKTGLFFGDEEIALKIIEYSNPEWIYINDYTTNIHNIMKDKQNFRTLIIDDVDTNHVQALSEIKKLKSLIIISEGTEEISFLKSMNNLESLHISGLDTTNIEFITQLKKLKELHLPSVEKLDINCLKKLPNLRSLILTDGDDITNYNAISDLKKLKYIGLPPNISQDEFNSIINNNSALEFIDMIFVDEITNLSILDKLKHLKGLSIGNDITNYSDLYNLKKLQYLSLYIDEFEDNPEKISELEKNLPDCVIVPGEGICMGTGWILLLFPLCFLAISIIKHFRKPD